MKIYKKTFLPQGLLFFKICLATIKVGLLVVFFVLGVVKSVLATIGTYPCAVAVQAVIERSYTNDTYDTNTLGGVTTIEVYGTLFPKASLTTVPKGTPYNYLNSAPLYYWVWNGSLWHFLDQAASTGTTEATDSFISAWNSSPFFEGYVQPGQHPSSVYPLGCPTAPTCTDEKAALEAECGGPDKYYIDEETCEGHCLPDDDCTDEYTAKIVECGSVQDIIKWSNETCEGLCSYVPQNAGPPRCEN